ncbi:MAG TPA: hypothetical protein VGJ93_15265 [Desulfuromonadaceae bacterium]|jgi:hypothetical protein
MAFSLDRTRSFIRVEESNLLSLLSSNHSIVPAAEYCQGHACDAFICVINEYNLWRVYIALHDQQLKSNLVFVTDPIRPDEKKLAALVGDATIFATQMGFSMETVKLDFSPAIREVIIRDTKVLREPSIAVQLAAALLAVEALQAEKKELSKKGFREQALVVELEELRAKLTAVAAVQQAAILLPTETATTETIDLQADLNALQKDVGLFREQKEDFSRRLVDAEKALQKSQEENDNVKATLKGAKDALKSGKEAARLAKEELKSLKQESQLLTRQLKHEQLECVKAKNELEAVQHEFLVYKSIQHDILADKDTVEVAHQREIEELKAQIVRLAAELKANDSSGEIEVLRTALAVAEESLTVEKTKNESALQEMDALERNAATELKLLKKKVDALSAEKQLLEKIAAEMKNKANGEIEHQQQVNQSQRRAAIKKVNALKEEIRQLSEARAVMASPTGMVPAAQNVSLPAEDTNKNPFGSQETSFASDPFGSYEASEYLEFLPDKSLKGIPYTFSTDIIEIHRSFNKVHAAPTGKQAQKCDGFVCLVSEGGKSLVYVAWLMNSSGEVLVCRPECVSDASDPYQILRQGIGYFERIGFIVDIVNLEGDLDKRQLQLDELAIFCLTITDCAA